MPQRYCALGAVKLFSNQRSILCWMLPRNEGVGCGGDAQLSAQKIPLLYPGQDAAFLPHLPRSSGILSMGSGAGGFARSHWEGNEKSGPFEGSCIRQWVQSPWSWHASGSCWRSRMSGWRSCSIFISVLSIAYDIEKIWFSSGRQILFPACSAVSGPVSLSGLLKSYMRTCI